MPDSLVDWFKNDFLTNLRSGITVSLISVPLSISLALANGATPLMGMRGAWWGGIFSSMLGGSGFNIHGPTGVF